MRTVNNIFVPTKTIPNSVTSWQVRAVGATNETSSYALGSLAPANVAGPALLSPPAGATLQQPNDPPLLAWQPVSGAVAYTVSVDADNDFVGATEIRTKSTSLVVPNALTAGDWYWKVAADLGNGISSASSEERRFDVLALPDPTMVGPQNNLEVQDVVLDWNPVVGAKSYEIQVARNNDFTTIIETKTGIQGTNYSPLDHLRQRPVLLARAVGRRQRPVHAVERCPLGASPGPTPTRPYSRYPADGANVSAPLFLQWDPVPHASEYELQIGHERVLLAGTSRLCRIAGTTYTPFQFVDSPGHVHAVRADEHCRPGINQTTYWRVRPLDRPFTKAGDTAGRPGPVLADAVLHLPTARHHRHAAHRWRDRRHPDAVAGTRCGAPTPTR